jgi:hypothetical protein
MSVQQILDRPPPAWLSGLLAQADAAEARDNAALAAAILRRAADAAPSAALLRRLGLMLLEAGRLPEATAPLEGALARAPGDAEVRYGLSICRYALGRYREAAPLAVARYELPRLQARAPREFPYAAWRGESLAGKHLLVFPELAAADQLLAARFVPGLAAADARITLLCAPELAPLLAQSLPGVRVLPASGEVEFDDPDAWSTTGVLMQLAATQGVPQPPSLSVPAPKSKPVRCAFAPGELPAAEADRIRAALPAGFVEIADAASDLARAAAQMAAADLVVCMADLVAQIASGLGAPTLALVPPRDVHWSFAQGPQGALWHPTVELVRTDPRGSWDVAVERLLDAVRSRQEA